MNGGEAVTRVRNNSSVERNLIVLTFNELKKYNDIEVTSHSLDISMRLHHTVQIFL